MEEIKILSETIIIQENSFRKVIQYLSGWHPTLGKLTFGLTGKETIVEKEIIFAKFVIKVVD